MRQFILRAFLLLIGFLFIPLIASAQDVLTVKADNSGLWCWDVTVKNANAGRVPINNIKFHIQNSGLQLNVAPPSTWDGTVNNAMDSAFFVATQGSITQSQSLSGFILCVEGIDSAKIDKPITFDWATYSNTNLVSSGTITVIPVVFQTLAKRDTVKATSTTVGPDPCFSFTVFDSNSASAAISAVSFQVLNPVSGTIRPSGIMAPSGWLLDSLTSSTAYFHAGIGNQITSGKSQGGFSVCLRANPNVTNFPFVWRAYDEGHALIDRDTIRILPGSPGATSFVSTDTVRATNQGGCLYNFSLSNFHNSNPAPPSRITKFVLTSSTNGVSFESVTSTPQNWAKALGTGNTSLTYQSVTQAAGLASGLTETTFAANVTNPTGGPFVLHWQTFTDATEVSSGDLNLTCTQALSATDTVRIQDGSSTCCFQMSVNNSHNPPSNLYAVSVSIPAGKGKFVRTNGSSSSSLNWGISQVDDQSIRYFTSNTGTDFQAHAAVQTLGFCIEPAKAGEAVPVNWVTYDQQNATIASGSVNATCSPITSLCDSVQLVQVPSASCTYGFLITNQRGTGATVNTITITPNNGWQIDSAGANIPWSTTVEPNKSSVRFSSSTGIADGTFQPFAVRFIGFNTSNDFSVDVTTIDANSNTCKKTIAITCQSTVGVEATPAVSPLTMSVAPNPVHGSSTVTFELPRHENVTMTLIDLLGRTQEVMLTNQSFESGSHSVMLNGSDLAPGSYYLRLETGSSRITKKIVITR